jgi:dienelactone hydrolase
MLYRSLYALLALCLCNSVLGGCAGPTASLSITTTAPDGASEQIPTTLRKPDGPGPFPALVIMHDCSGLGRSSSGAPDRWAREMVQRGYVILIPDSFTTRGHPDGVCTDASPSRAEVSPSRRVRDAYAALAYLRTLPYVEARRVGLMGGSHGGTTTLASMVAPETDTEALAADRRAGVYKPVAPVLILIGEKDDWTPAEPCRKLTEAARGAGHPVTIKVYPGAYHSFDSYNPVRYVETRVNANSPTGRGATTGGNYMVWTDSIREVVAFFGQHLK